MSSQPPYPDPYGGRDGPAPYGPGYGYGPTGPPGQPPPVPSSVRAAVGLMWAGAGLVVVGLLLLPSSVDEFRDQAGAGTGSAGVLDEDTAVRVGIAFALLIGSVQLGLWIWMAVMNRRGRHWARVVATVLGALSLAFTLLGLMIVLVLPSATTGADTLNTVLSVLTSVLAVAIIVLLWRPDSNRWYDAMRPRR